MSWLNEDAPLNIENMLVTEDVSHAPISPLNEEAPANIESIAVTDDVFHVPIF